MDMTFLFVYISNFLSSREMVIQSLHDAIQPIIKS